jgi:hypothetical protein
MVHQEGIPKNGSEEGTGDCGDHDEGEVLKWGAPIKRRKPAEEGDEGQGTSVKEVVPQVKGSTSPEESNESEEGDMIAKGVPLTVCKFTEDGILVGRFGTDKIYCMTCQRERITKILMAKVGILTDEISKVSEGAEEESDDTSREEDSLGEEVKQE